MEEQTFPKPAHADETDSFRPAEQPISIGEWMVTLFLAAIPIIGFIMLLVWAFGDGAAATKANWAKATLLWLVIMAAFYTLMVILFGAFFFTFFSA